MDLKNTVNEYVAGVEKMTDEFKKQFGAMLLDENIDSEQLDLFKGLFGMIEISNRLVREQALTIHEINEKLDKLLENQEKES